MIVVEKEPGAEEEPLRTQERCCFCRERTVYWYTPKDVACCLDCADDAREEDVPEKQVWMTREKIANSPRRRLG